MSFAPELQVAVAGSPQSIVVGDFNRDGVSDFVTVNNNNAAWASFVPGYGDGGFAPHADIGMSDGGNVGIQLNAALADLNGDGYLDLVSANSPVIGGSTTAFIAALGNSDGGFNSAIPYAGTVNGFSTDVAIADFDGDGILDVAVSTESASSVCIFRGNGDGTFQVPPLMYPFLHGNTYGLAASDLDGDGNADLVLLADFGPSVAMGYGDGGFAAAVEYPVATFAEHMRLADLNAEGHTDIVYSDFHGDLVTVMLGYGDGGFALGGSYASDHLPWSVAVGDLNGDGYPDIAVADDSPGGGVDVFLGNGDGTFGSKISLETIGAPDGIAIADFNGDGKPDIAASINGNTAAVLLNTSACTAP